LEGAEEACYGGADFMERSCAVAREKDINNISGLDSFPTPQVFYTNFCNHAHRLRLEKLL
jgi:hypothetical protein